MNNLIDLYNNSEYAERKTDKGTWHDYIRGYYNETFTPFKDTDIKLLEIGIYAGDSTRLWRKFFSAAELYIMDIPLKQMPPWDDAYLQSHGLTKWNDSKDTNPVINHLNDTLQNVTGYVVDGFTESALCLFEDDMFDFIIEDGPHTIETQIFAAKFWTKKLKVGGKLIIEDMQNISVDYKLIVDSIKSRSELSCKVIDLRANKNRYDDVIIEITKNRSTDE